MKKGLLITFLLFSLFIIFGQNGIKKGDLFILLEDTNTISINSYENGAIKLIRTFPITLKSLYTTDHKERVAILDTAKKEVTIYSIKSGEIKLTIPFEINARSILLEENNLFIGGDKRRKKLHITNYEQVLLQYHLKNEQWYQLEIPINVGAIDDILVNDSLVIAFDNIVFPKYLFFYHKNITHQLELSHFTKLKYNGPYEHISQGRITDKYIGLLSKTERYYRTDNFITIYNNLDLTNSFALSFEVLHPNDFTIIDFLLIKDKIVIADGEKGVGIFEIEDSYFKKNENKINENHREDISKIQYTKYQNYDIIKLTLIPFTDKVVLTLLNKNGTIKHEIIEI